MSLPYCFRSQLFRSGSATGQQCTHCGIGAVPWCVVLVPPIRMGCRPPPFAQCVCQYQVFFEKNLGTKKNQRKAQKSMSEKSLFLYSSFITKTCVVQSVHGVHGGTLCIGIPYPNLPSSSLFKLSVSHHLFKWRSISAVGVGDEGPKHNLPIPPNSNKISAKLANFAFFEFVFCLEEISIDKNRIWSR